MTTLDKRYPDLLGPEAEPATVRIVEDFEALRLASTPPPALADAIDRAVQARMLQREQQPERRRRSGWPAWRRHPLLAALSALVVLSTILGSVYELEFRPTAVSAQAVLRQAVQALTPPANRVAHVIMSLSGSDPTMNVRIDSWVRFDNKGTLLWLSETDTSPQGALLGRTVQIGDTRRTYDATYHIASTYQSSDLAQQDTFGVRRMRRLLFAAERAPDRNLRLVGTQTLDGVAVYVVQAKTSLPQPWGTQVTTFYIDQRTYAIRGQDDTFPPAHRGAPTFVSSTRVLLSTTVPLSAVPRGLLTFKVPAHTRTIVVPSQSETRSASVSQAIARSPQPALILSRALGGLVLQDVAVCRVFDRVLGCTGSVFAPHSGMQATVVSFGYGSSTRAVEGTGTRQFDIMMSSSHLALPTRDTLWMTSTPAQPLGAPRELTLRIAGQTVHAQYFRVVSGSQSMQILAYRHGRASVELQGQGLSKAQFFAMVRALVDGRTHPSVAAHLQRELDAYRQTAPF